MPLPIPDIMQNASNALDAAKRCCEVGDTANISIHALRDSLKKVSSDDLAAVMNEVGRLYAGVNNIQIIQIGSRINPDNKAFEFGVIIDFGMGPRTLMIPMPFETADNLINSLRAELDKLEKPAGRKLITQVS